MIREYEWLHDMHSVRDDIISAINLNRVRNVSELAYRRSFLPSSSPLGTIAITVEHLSGNHASLKHVFNEYIDRWV